ncbi:noncompact myelin-associated protein [Clinocottus analis]|uniref:noncompact myelin-associated protein n=1 Tax=Clinocottus analis TaxID=304258 RepID=UPI0035C14E91
MQASTVSPVTNNTAPSNTTKTKEQILIQSSGAMIAVIVLGIIIILAILLIILKTYNRRTHVSRVLGARGSKPRPKTSLSTVNSNVPLTPMVLNPMSDAIVSPSPASAIASELPRAALNSVEGNHIEQLSTISEATVMTQSDSPSIENT